MKFCVFKYVYESHAIPNDFNRRIEYIEKICKKKYALNGLNNVTNPNGHSNKIITKFIKMHYCYLIINNSY